MLPPSQARRLAEMMGNAEQHQQQRHHRVAVAEQAEQVAGDSGLRNEDGLAGTRRAGDAFLGAATKEVFGALAAAGTSVEARVNSRKHFRER